MPGGAQGAPRAGEVRRAARRVRRGRVGSAGGAQGAPRASEVRLAARRVRRGRVRFGWRRAGCAAGEWIRRAARRVRRPPVTSHITCLIRYKKTASGGYPKAEFFVGLSPALSF